MRVPSGLQAGDPSVAPGACVSRRGSPPATSTSQRLELLLLFGMDHSVTAKTAVFPSGERAGAPTRWKDQRSCAVIGRFAGACADDAAAPDTRRMRAASRRLMTEYRARIVSPV